MKRDESLDFLRDAAGRLLLEGAPAGHLVSSVESMWSLAHPWRLQERVWLAVEWAGGGRDADVEDYGPWVFRDALQEGGSSGATNLMRAATRWSG